MKSVFRIVSILFGLLMIGGVVKSSPKEPCTTNDKLLETMGQMLADSKREADAAKKKYTDMLEQLEKNPCKK